MNSSLIDKEPPTTAKGVRCLEIPATEIADRIGNRQVANLVALGAFIEATKMVKPVSILIALEKTLPKHRQFTLPTNKEAFREGRELILRGNQEW